MAALPALPALSAEQLAAFGACPLSERDDLAAKVADLEHQLSESETKIADSERRLSESESKLEKATTKLAEEKASEIVDPSSLFPCSQEEYERLVNIEKLFKKLETFWDSVKTYGDCLKDGTSAAVPLVQRKSMTQEEMVMMGNMAMWGFPNCTHRISEIFQDDEMASKVGPLVNIEQVREAQREYKGIMCLTIERLPDTGPNGKKFNQSGFSYEIRGEMWNLMGKLYNHLQLSPETEGDCKEALYVQMNEYFDLIRQPRLDFMYRAQTCKPKAEHLIEDLGCFQDAIDRLKAEKASQVGPSHRFNVSSKKKRKAGDSDDEDSDAPVAKKSAMVTPQKQPAAAHRGHIAKGMQPSFQAMSPEHYNKCKHLYKEFTKDDLAEANALGMGYKSSGAEDTNMDLLWRVYKDRYGEYEELGQQFPIHPAFHNESTMYMYVQRQQPGQPIVWGLMSLPDMKKEYKNSAVEILPYEIFPSMSIPKPYWGTPVADKVVEWRVQRKKEIQRTEDRRKAKEDAQNLHAAAGEAATAASLVGSSPRVSLHRASSDYGVSALSFAYGDNEEPSRMANDSDDDDDEEGSKTGSVAADPIVCG